MTLFERVFGGNDAVYGLTEAAIDAAIAANGEEKAVSFPDTAYALPVLLCCNRSKGYQLKRDERGSWRGKISDDKRKSAE